MREDRALYHRSGRDNEYLAILQRESGEDVTTQTRNEGTADEQSEFTGA
jgi:hypothetical protein